MITIKIPSNYRAERAYLLHIIFEDRLGISYEVEPGSENHTIIVLPNGNTIIFEDHFFSLYNENKSYLSEENLPAQVDFLVNRDYFQDGLAVFFGLAEMEIQENQILLKADLPAQIFFLLSRWEEKVIQERDELGRPKEESLFVVKLHLNERPLVDEYITAIASLIQKSGYEKFNVKKHYQVIPSHDVDFVKKWRNTFHAWKEIGGDTFKRRNITRALYNFTLWSASKLKLLDEPNNTIDELIQKSLINNRKAVFFFMSGGETQWDNYLPEDAEIIKRWADKIVASKFSLGIHPSIEAAKNADLLKEELTNYKQLVQYQICCSRQHYLKMLIPETWNMLDDNNLGWDSSCGFSHHVGFRCGTSYPFRVFDIDSRKILKLREKPLILMDTAIVEHMKLTEKDAIDRVRVLKRTIKTYGGEFVFLLHNSSLRAFEYRNHKNFFEELYK